MGGSGYQCVKIHYLVGGSGSRLLFIQGTGLELVADGVQCFGGVYRCVAPLDITGLVGSRSFEIQRLVRPLLNQNLLIDSRSCRRFLAILKC